MRRGLFLALISLFIHSASRTAAPDLHIVIETSFTYMDHTRTYAVENWIGHDKSCMKRGSTIWINRKDRGLSWSIDLDEKTYTETEINKARSRVRSAAHDVHTLGWEYEPVYDWIIHDTGERKTIDGYPCRLFTASGDADFSEIDLKFWICIDSSKEYEADYRQFLLEQLKDDTYLKPIYETLKKFKHSFLLLREENVKNPIAPTWKKEVRLVKLESVSASPDTYELPEDLKKISGEDR